MLVFEDVRIEYKSQGFEAKELSFSPSADTSAIMLESTRKTAETGCPKCTGQVHIYDSFQKSIKDMPLWIYVPMTLLFSGHRYRCQSCEETFTEEIPFVYPGTRITHRAANWIKGFLKNKLSIKAIQNSDRYTLGNDTQSATRSNTRSFGTA